MANNTEKLNKLLEVLEAINSGSPSYEEVAKSIATIIQTVKEINTTLEQKLIDRIDNKLNTAGEKLKEQEGEFSEIIKEAKEESESTLSSFRKRTLEKINSVFTKSQVNQKLSEVLKSAIKVSNEIQKEFNEKITEIDKQLSKEEITEIVEEVFSTKKIDETPEDLRDKLENLNGDERLELSAIKGLKEALDKASGANKVSGLFGTRRIFQPYLDRFTADTDGATKIFYLKREPLRTDNIEVSGTDFPIILDPTVDFTVEGRKLTLTDAVPAPSSGATLIIKYYA